MIEFPTFLAVLDSDVHKYTMDGEASSDEPDSESETDDETSDSSSESSIGSADGQGEEGVVTVWEGELGDGEEIQSYTGAGGRIDGSGGNGGERAEETTVAQAPPLLAHEVASTQRESTSCTAHNPLVNDVGESGVDEAVAVRFKSEAPDESGDRKRARLDISDG